MIGRIKSAVKSVLMERKIEEYYAGLDAQFVSYDTWIKEQEENYVSGLLAPSNLPVQIIEFAECVDTFWKDYGLDTLEKSTKEDFSGSQSAVPLAKEDKILLFVNQKENLADGAIQIITDYFAANPECILVYGDEDEWNSNRTIRMNPWFKPDFAPDTLLEYLYYGNVFAVRKYALCNIEWKASKDYLANLYDLCFQLSFPVKKEKIGHVQYVCYHAQALKRLCAEAKYEEIREPIIRSLEKKEKHFFENSFADENIDSKKVLAKRVLLNRKPEVSIIIPSKDHPEVLEVCLDSLIKTVKNRKLDVIVVDNGSREENRLQYERMKNKYGFNYLHNPMDFNFSHMCNLGAECACGDYLLFLNDDIEASHEGWLDVMCSHAVKQHVGAVGAKLYYPDSEKMQHAGITNLRLGPVHKMQFLEDTRPYYDGRNQYDHNVLAVTAACLMVRKEVFQLCGGFCEELAVAFNDVDFCFRLYEKGFFNVVCNSIFLYHHESLSRGSDETIEKQNRLQTERKKLYALHPDLYGKDPFYHPNLNQEILDTNFSYEYQYPAGRELDVVTPVRMQKEIQQQWYNECLLISMEYAQDLTAWMDSPKHEGDEFYFQGYQFVIGSDNSCFARYILLKSMNNEEVYEIPCGEVFRPDLEKNVVEGHVSLCGFALVISKKDLPKGRYQVGCMAKSLVSRQVLCRFVNKFVEN